jgi:drug/metabolite transporter (DMT)-like permease
MNEAEAPTRGSELQGALCLLVAVFCFASVPLFLRYLTRFPEVDAWTVNAIRYGVATVFWLPFIVQRTIRRPAERKVWKDAILASAVNVVGQIGWALGAYYNEAGVIAFVVRSSFFFAIVYSVILLPREREIVRRPRFWVGAIGIVLGIVFMFGHAFRSGKSSPLGLLILLGTAAAWGMYGVLVKRNLGEYDERVSFAVNSIYTTGVLVIAMFLFGNWRALGSVPGQVWGLLVVSAFAGIVFAHILLYRGIHTLGPLVAQGASCVQPFLTALGAWIFLKEVLGLWQWAGGYALIGSCVILLSLRVKRRSGLPDGTRGLVCCPVDGQDRARHEDAK